MKGRAGLSNTLQTLLLLFNQTLGARFGIKVRVRGSGLAGQDYAFLASSFKRAFYKARRMAPEYQDLALLSTSDPEIFMILKQQERESNGTDRLEDDFTQDSSGSTLGSEEVFQGGISSCPEGIDKEIC